MSLTRKITKNEQNKLLQLQNSTRKTSLNKFIKSLERKHVNLQYLRPRQNGPLGKLKMKRPIVLPKKVYTPKVVVLPQRAYIEEMRGTPKSSIMCRYHCKGEECWAHDNVKPEDKTCPFVPW
jgi:hypothetical protein